MKNIKTGVIGVGYLGRFHALKYAGLEGVELVGVADIDQERAAYVAGECGCRAFTDHRELAEYVDAVSIAVPTSCHHHVSLYCLENKVDLLLEKPMTVTTSEADELVRLAEDKGCILQIGHLERFNPALQAAQPFISEPMFIESSRITMFRNRGADVDVVLDLMIHDIDIILNMIKAPLSEIRAVGMPVVTETTDIANARLMFEGGGAANINVSRVSQNSARKMKIFQPDSCIDIDFAERKMTNTRLTEVVPHQAPKTTVETRTFASADALKSEVEHFAYNVRHRIRPSVSGLEGRQALDTALRVIEQIERCRQPNLTP